MAKFTKPVIRHPTPEVLCQVRCNNQLHRIAVIKGKLVLVDHPNYECDKLTMALASGLGKEKDHFKWRCYDVLKHWRNYFKANPRYDVPVDLLDYMYSVRTSKHKKRIHKNSELKYGEKLSFKGKQSPVLTRDLNEAQKISFTNRGGKHATELIKSGLARKYKTALSEWLLSADLSIPATVFVTDSNYSYYNVTPSVHFSTVMSSKGIEVSINIPCIHLAKKLGKDAPLIIDNHMITNIQWVTEQRELAHVSVCRIEELKNRQMAFTKFNAASSKGVIYNNSADKWCLCLSKLG